MEEIEIHFSVNRDAVKDNVGVVIQDVCDLVKRAIVAEHDKLVKNDKE